MFDSIGLYSQCDKVNNSIRYLTDIRENIDSQSGEVTSYGKLKNMRVKVKGDFLSINGSLPKYLFGDNIRELTRKHTEEAIESLSDGLHLDISKSKPFRIDVASNFIMKEPLQKYYSGLNSIARYEKKPFRDGVLFSTNKISLEFYDKVKELKKKKNAVPEIFESKNILRYEAHFTKRLQEIFNQDINTKNLYDESFYIKAVDKWKNLYFRINKNRVLTFNKRSISMMDSRTIFNQLSAVGLNQVGKEQLLRMLELERSNLSKMQFKRIKDKINSISELPELTELNDSLKELDAMVIQRAKYYR